MDIELPDSAAFLARLSAIIHPPPSLWDSRITDGGHRYVLSGRVDSARIRFDVARIPPRSGLFVFAPRFEGRIAEDGLRLVGHFLVPVPFLLLGAGLLFWIAAVVIPTLVAAARGAYPGKAFLDNVVPLLAGTGVLLGFVAFAVWQYHGNQRWMTRVLRDAAGSGGRRRRAVR